MTIVKVTTKEMSTQYNIISKEYHSLRPPKQDKSYDAKELLLDIDQKKIRELFEEFDDEMEIKLSIKKAWFLKTLHRSLY